MAEANGKKARKKKDPVDPNETPAQRFKRLGTVRVNNALAALDRVGKLNGRAYESTPEQRAAIVKALEAATVAAANSLQNGVKAGGTFTL